MKKRKLTRESLAELAKRMPVLSEQMQMTYMGGLDPNDCVWRCIAYMNSCGTSYDPNAALAVASGYYGTSFDPNNYAFSGTKTDLAATVSGSLSSSYCSGAILVFDPSQTPGWSGNGTSRHAIVITGYRMDNSGNAIYDVVDPQAGGATSSIKASDLPSGSYSVQVR